MPGGGGAVWFDGAADPPGPEAATSSSAPWVQPTGPPGLASTYSVEQTAGSARSPREASWREVSCSVTRCAGANLVACAVVGETSARPKGAASRTAATASTPMAQRVLRRADMPVA